MIKDLWTFLIKVDSNSVPNASSMLRKMEVAITWRVDAGINFLMCEELSGKLDGVDVLALKY